VIANLVRLSEVDPDTVRPGWVALLVVLALAVATFLLWRNMGKQLKKINFDEDRTAAPPEPGQQTDTGGDVSPDTEADHKPRGDRPDRGNSAE
jgi:hypothetical protein